MKGFWKGQSKTAAFLLWEEMFYGKTDLHRKGQISRPTIN